jgi:hypothetical protein
LQTFRDADFCAESDTPWLGGKEGVGTAFDEEPFATLGVDLSAETIFGFDKRDPHIWCGVSKTMRGRQPGDASAEHDDVTVREG